MPPKITGNHIEKMDRQFPLTSKFQLNFAKTMVGNIR